MTDMPEYIGDGQVHLGPGSFRLHPHVGWDSDFAAGIVPQSPALSFAWIEIAPDGSFRPWSLRHRRSLVMWWLKRRGWVFYYGNGERA